MPVIITLIVSALILLFSEFGVSAFLAGLGIVALVMIAAGKWDE